MALRHSNKKKNNYSLVKIIGLLFVGGLLLFVPRVLKEREVFFEEKSETLSFTQYYVPVTRYFSQTKDVTRQEIIDMAKSGKLYAEKGDLKDLSSLLKVDDIKEIDAATLPEGIADDEVAILRAEKTIVSLKSLSYEGSYLWDKPDSYNLKAKVEKGSNFEITKITKVTALGDVMLSRHVNTQIKKYGFEYPWLNTKKRTADADITFANLEVPLSDLVAAPASGMSFVAPTKNIAQLVSAGIDVVSFANNHSANFGKKVFDDSLVNLKAANLGVCGAGINDIEARKPIVVEKNRVKFGFVCYNAITGGLAAKSNSSGVATLKIEPWYRDDAEDIKRLQNDVKAAKKEADVVIVSPHWGVEYKVNPNESQRKVARAAIEAGADMIIGTHPHVVQGAEVIDGKYVNYSLGNFIFDQEWSVETTEGAVLETYFYGDRVVAANIVPIKIKNYAQPSFVDGLTMLSRIAKASIGF